MHWVHRLLAVLVFVWSYCQQHFLDQEREICLRELYKHCSVLRWLCNWQVVIIMMATAGIILTGTIILTRIVVLMLM